MTHYLDYIRTTHIYPPSRGITSVCSAHPYVIEATLRQGKHLPWRIPLLIESTCNQVNQFGGYTGMQPRDFVRWVRNLAQRVGLPQERLILGGDHLGPLPWAHEPPERAMAKAQDLVRAYVAAGYTKIHLDCSMPLGREDALPVERIAERTAMLARVAEETAGENARHLRYIIGSEVPTAGGARAHETHIHVTSPDAAAETLEATRRAFREQGLDAAWERVVALVVQPGVEFGVDFVHEYDPWAARSLARFIERHPGLVYEAHSTDYQLPEALRALVDDHFAILKVGPALTFAFREALFALDHIAAALGIDTHLRDTLEHVMLERPEHWRTHYHGSEEEQRLARAYSFSDRIRYYWADPTVQEAVERVLRALEERSPLPLPLLSQYLPTLYPRVRRGQVANRPRSLLLAHIGEVLDTYAWATRSYPAPTAGRSTGMGGGYRGRIPRPVRPG